MATTVGQRWDLFADEVLPWIGLRELPHQIESACPELTPERVTFWVGQFNTAWPHGYETSDGGTETSDEADGRWYDRMKAIALDCIEEAISA